MTMTNFREELEKLYSLYSYEVDLCYKTLKAEKRSLGKEIKELQIELTGVPEKGLFGENLRKEHLDKIKELQNKQKLL